MSKLLPLIHPSFSISGQVFDINELLEYSQVLLNSSESWQHPIGQFFIDWLSPSPDITLKSSGTTKGVKEIKVLKKAMILHAQMSCSFFELKPKEKIAHFLSNDFIAGKMILVRALVAGLDLWCYKPSKDPLNGVNEQFDWASMVPMQLENSLASLFKIKKLLIGGAPLSLNLNKKAIQATKESRTSIYISFGMTETLSHIAIAELSLNGTPLFKVLPGISISRDVFNCLQINAGYLERPVSTSDVVELVTPNSFYWLGRVDNLINSGGIKIQPESIEKDFATVFEYPFYYYGLSDPLLGQKLCLVVLLENKEQALKAIKLFDFKQPYSKPKSMLLVKRFVYTSSEKIRRSQSLSNGFEEYILN